MEEHPRAPISGQALGQDEVSPDAFQVAPSRPDPTQVPRRDAADEPTDPGTGGKSFQSSASFSPSSSGSGEGREVLRVLRLPRWKHYRDLRFLAEGGMGRVFSAFDPDLQRPVALKFLQREDHELAKRFELEAQSQAKVDHPNVCKIYEVGEWKGQPYMAMQLIEGDSLAACKAALNQEQKLAVMERVAEAVHAAHRQGLIHRDLKPGNVMIERGEDGNPIPYVLDFGLARGMEATGHTVQGSIVGTYHYMAPEQARGDHEKLDRRTDVYALGCTLFELFTGAPPFGETEGVDCLRRILDESVPLLRAKDAQIAVDLETIVAKCLEKDPARRYLSARALAEELRRFRDGEPILARPATLAYRAGKYARRNKSLVAVAGIGLVAVLALGSFGLYQWITASRRAHWAQHFGQEAERIEALVRYAHLQPQHDVGPEFQQIAERLVRLQEQSKNAGTLAEGPASYALGRSHLALGDAAKARTYLDRAWSLGLRTPEVSFALGRTMGLEYQVTLERARRIPDSELREARIKELQRQFRDPALHYLRAGSAAALESQDYYGALLAFYEQRHDDAIQLCRKSLVQRPWFYEAKLLEGEALQAQAKDLKSPQEVLQHLPLALAAFREASRLAPSDDAAYVGEARVWRDHLVIGSSVGADWKSPLDACERAVTSAMSIRADSAVALGIFAMAMSRAGESVFKEGGNPEPIMQKAVWKAEQTLSLDLSNIEARAAQISAFEVLGYWKFRKGQDPFPDFDRGIQVGAVALDMDSLDATLLSLVTTINRRKMTLEMQQGRDPLASFEASQRLLDRFLKLYPGQAAPYREIASLLLERAEYEQSHGGDPRPTLERARTANDKAIALNPNNPALLDVGGNIFLVRAQYEIMVAMDPQNSIQEAIRFFESARALSANRSRYALALTATLLLEAEFRFDQGLDPMPSLIRAEQLLSQGMQNRTGYFWGHHLAGDIARQKAQYALRLHTDPSPYLRHAEMCYVKSWKLGKWAESQAQLAALCVIRARWSPSRKVIDQGKEAVRIALETHPDHAEALLQLGALETAAARLASGIGKTRAKEKARATILRALQINGNLKLRAERVLP